MSSRCAFAPTVALAAMVFAYHAAEAGELLVMPYACSVVGGQPVLTPSNDRGYSVIGRRDERDFSSCSPVRPNLCRQWKVYRFDVDCGGTRVPWAAVAANARHDGRAWFEGGRLQIEMPPPWGIAPDDACAPDFNRPFGWPGGGFRRFCAERRARQHPVVVEIPDGYAPMMGIDAIFVTDRSNEPPPQIAHHGELPPAAEVPNTTARFAPARERPPATDPSPAPRPTQSLPAEATGSKAERPREPADIAQRNAAPERKALATEKQTPATDKPALQAEKPQPAPTDAASPSPALDVKPTIINGPDAQAQHQQTGSNTAEPVTFQAAPAPMVTASISAKETAAPASIGEGNNSSLPDGNDNATFLSFASRLGPLSLGATSLAALALVGLSLLAWRTRSSLEMHPNRDIGALSLGGRRDLVVTGTDPYPPPGQGPMPEPGPAPPHIGDEIPCTREQALRILGMGVAGDDSEAAIKKIVDGLRMSWHPDGAKSDDERALRELRMKQINAAWDIISRRGQA